MGVSSRGRGIIKLKIRLKRLLLNKLKRGVARMLTRVKAGLRMIWKVIGMRGRKIRKQVRDLNFRQRANSGKAIKIRARITRRVPRARMLRREAMLGRDLLHRSLISRSRVRETVQVLR